MLFEDHIDLFADLNISGQVKSIVSGVSPMVVTSRILNINFNADLLDDEEGSYYLDFQNFTGRAAFSQLPQISPGLIGRYSTGTGDMQQITLGSGFSLPGGQLTYTETDPTVPGHVKAITGTQISNWDTAYASSHPALSITGQSYLTLNAATQQITAGAINLNSTHTSGVLPVTKGGTGLSSLGSSGQFLRVNGAGNALEYYSLPSPVVPTLQQVTDQGAVTSNDITIEKAGSISSILVRESISGAFSTMLAYGSTAQIRSTNGTYVASFIASPSDARLYFQNSTLADQWSLQYISDSVATLGSGDQLRVQQDPVHNNDLARKAYIDSLVAAIPGTVTSVSSGNLTGLFTTLVSNATSTPSISFTLSDQLAYTVFARGSGNGAPSFQALVADHIPDLNASKITTGTLPVTRGGTGAGTLTGILVGNGTSAITAITGSGDQLLRRNTANTGYEFFTHDFISSTLIGANNGIAPLDGTGKIPSGYLPVTGMQYKGTWNASTNTPTLSDATGQDGWYYRVTVAGTQNLGSGNITFSIGDDIIHNGVSWERAPSGVAATNLAVGTRTNTTLPITNSNGTGFSIPLATGSLAGIISGDDYTKLQNAITENQTITVSGAVNGSGTTSIVTTFRNSAALSVIGRSANSVGAPSDITAVTDGHVLRRSGTSLGFGLIGDSSISSLSWGKLTGVPTTLSGYGIQTEADSRYVNTTGDTMTGTLNGTRINLNDQLEITNPTAPNHRIQLITTPDYSRFNMGYGSHVTYQIHVVENGTTYFVHNIGDGSQQRMVWDTNKNVTFNVAERVHVNGDVRSTGQLVSTVATGTSPLQVTSSTLVTNLNADFLDGQHGSYYLSLSNATGVLPVTKGGTGLNTIGTAGQMLRSTGTALEFFTPSYLTGTGTAGYIPKWGTSSSLNDSAIYQDGSGRIGIGTTSMDVKLVVDGGFAVYGNTAIRPDGVGNGIFNVWRDIVVGDTVNDVHGTVFIHDGIGTPLKNSNAAFEVKSTTKGVLFPRMTAAQRDAIVGPAGMVVYNTTANAISLHNGTSWIDLASSSSFPTNYVTTDTNQSSLGGNKAWTGSHSWALSSNVTPSVAASSIAVGKATSGIYLISYDNDANQAFALRTFAASGGYQLTLDKGGVETATHGNSSQWNSAYTWVNTYGSGLQSGPYVKLTGDTMSGSLTISGDGNGLYLHQGAAVYKRVGGGLTLKRHNDAAEVSIENAAGDQRYPIWSDAYSMWRGGTTPYSSGDLSDIGLVGGAYYAHEAASDKPGGANSYILHIPHHSDSSYWMQIGSPYLYGSKLYVRKHIPSGAESWIPIAYESWVSSNFVSSSAVVSAGNGLTGGGVVSTNPTITLGTPGNITLGSSNSVSTNSHTHAFVPGGTTSQYIRGDGTLATFPAIPTNYVTTDTNQSSLSGTKDWTGAHSITTSSFVSFSLNRSTSTASVGILYGNANDSWVAGFDVNTGDFGLSPNTTTAITASPVKFNATTGLITTASHGNSSQWNSAYTWVNTYGSGLQGGPYVPTSRTVSAGNGLTGGGSLATNISLSVNFGTSAGTVAQGNDSRINNGQTAYGWGNHASAGYVPQTRELIFGAGDGLSVSGTSSTNLSVNRTVNYAVNFGTGSNQVARGNHNHDGVYVPTSRTITINGVTQNLSDNRSWTISSGVTGSGTTWTVPLWSSSSNISNSIMTQSGGKIYVGGSFQVDNTTDLNGSVVVNGWFYANNGATFYDNIYMNGTSNIIGGGSGHSSAVLTINSTSKGLLVPRMTYAQRIAISSPTAGLIVYQTNTASGKDEGFWGYEKGMWRRFDMPFS